MLCFTDWVPKATTRYYIGWSFIAILFLHMSVHVFFLFKDTVINCKSKAKEKLKSKQAQKLKDESLKQN